MIFNYSKTLALILILEIIVTFSAIGQSDWVTFKADAVLSFEVDVPSAMGVKKKDISTDLGMMTTTTYAHEGGEEDPNFLYVINVIEYPSGTFPSDSLELTDTFLMESISSIVEGMNGELVYQSEISDKVNGVGRLFRLKYDKGYGVIKGKVFLKDNVFLTLQVYTTKDKSLNDEMDDFLNSFRIKF